MNSRIKQIRQNAGLTQAQFSERIGLSRNYIALIEAGERVPSDRTISDICRVYGISLAWLQGGEGEMYVQRSDNEQLALMVADLLSDSDNSFRKRFVAAFLSFPPDKIAVLEEFIDSLNEQKSTEDT